LIYATAIYKRRGDKMTGELRKGVSDYYDATAREWADKWYPDDTMLPLLRRFVALLPGGPRVLDAGCGAGYESMRLKNLGADVVGIDISEESVKIARERNPGCRFEVTDCRMLARKEVGFFDGVAALALIVHIEDAELPLVFKNFRNALKPGGYVLLAFREGEGFSEERSYVEIGGVPYNRAFYLHKSKSVIESAEKAGFSYFEEWFLENAPGLGGWKYLVFRHPDDDWG